MCRCTTNGGFGATTAVALVLLLSSACSPESNNPSDGTEHARSSTEIAVTELDWDALIPEEWRPEKLLEGLSTDGSSLDDISDEDPRADPLMDKLMTLWKQAPVVEALDGKQVKLPGFVVPVEFDLNKVREFLLVPYYGACIHVPPPPANQIVHVVLPKGTTYVGEVFDTVWVTGVLQIERFSSEMAEAGYRIDAVKITAYP